MDMGTIKVIIPVKVLVVISEKMLLLMEVL